MEKDDLTQRLATLVETKNLVEEHGPNSDTGRAWLAEASATLATVDSELKSQFDHYLRYIGLPLSSDMLGPMWANMVGLLREAVVRVELDASSPVGDTSDRHPQPTAALSVTAPEPIDVKDLTVADVIRVGKRLKLSSVALLGTLFISWTFIVARFYPDPRDPSDSARMEFGEEFSLRFADREVLSALIPAVLEEAPDGLTTYEQVMASLLWQVKSQDGFAEFLIGDASLSVTVMFGEDALEFEWDRRSNVMTQILATHGMSGDPELLTQLNAEMNLFGVAFLDEQNSVVRSTDGGLAVIGSGR